MHHCLADQLHAVTPAPPGLCHCQQGDPAAAPLRFPAVVKGHRAHRRSIQIPRQYGRPGGRGPGGPRPRRRKLRLLPRQGAEIEAGLQSVGPLLHGASLGEGRVCQMARIVPPDHLDPRPLRPQQRDSGVAAGGRLPQLLQRDALQGRQQQADGAAMREHRRRFSVIGRRNVPHGRQQPGLDCLGRLRALYVPQVEPVVEVFQLRRVLPGDLPPGLLLPHAHADLPQVPPPVQGQALGLVNGAGGGAGAVEVAGVDRVDGNIRESARQRLDLPLAPVCDAAVGLSLGDAVQVALRLCVANQIDGGHGFLRPGLGPPF